MDVLTRWRRASLVARQVAGTPSSTYTSGGMANASSALFNDSFAYSVMTGQVWSEWLLSYIELSPPDGRPGNWGELGWAFFCSTRCFVAEFGEDAMYSVNVAFNMGSYSKINKVEVNK